MQSFAETLETMVDQASLSTVLAMLADIAGEKAEHIRANWQDEATAKVWDRAGQRIEKLVREVPV